MAIKKPRIIVVMPAYNAAKTINRTVLDIPKGFVDEILVVDDSSSDNTVQVAKKLGLTVFQHSKNLGYGGNQKTCYRQALRRNPDIVVMLHPDYQYDAALIEELVRPIVEDRYDLMFGSRIRTRQETLAGGMPPIKYYLNRIFCVIENIALGVNFSEHFSGFRAYSTRVLETIPFSRFSNDFVFDQQLMISAIAHEFRIGEVPVPVRYYKESSSIQFVRGAKFLIETLSSLVEYHLSARRFR